MSYFCNDKLIIMRRHFKFCLVLLMLSTMMHGQALSSLGVPKEITVGRLPDGIDFYLVSNAAQKGFADFALVRKSAYDEVRDRAALDSLPHFGSRKPYLFLSGNGAGYSASGYISSRQDATLFSFPDIPVYDQSVADSTILMMMDIAAGSRSPQAIIVSGDIKPDKIKERLNLLSMTVPRLYPDDGGSSYIWAPRDSLVLLTSVNNTSDVASIHAIYSAARLPRERMNTIQPLVGKAYADILGHIVSRRVERDFRSRGIPLAEVDFRYVDSASGSGDERYVFSVFTSSSCLDKAAERFSAVLSSIDKWGVSSAEYQDAKSTLISESKREAGGRVTGNREYVARCTSAYLYGAGLERSAAAGSVLAARSLPAETDLELFNTYAGALLDSAGNLTLRFDTPADGADKDVLRGGFNAAWREATPDEVAYKEDFGDTLSLFVPKGKVKLRNDTVEPVSGGRMWTFSNGIKVLYKKTDIKGEFQYTLMLRGGVASVPSLGNGEGAFVGDMLGLSGVAGLSGPDFLAMLEANGITMHSHAGISDLRIGGIAPKSKLQLLLRSLLSIADRRVPDHSEFEYYKASEGLRIDMGALSPRDVNSLMDSIMRPGYYYTERKFLSNLGDDLPERAEQYFEAQFSKVNDGLLVLTGDLDEERLKKELCLALGGFRTQKRFAQRPHISSRLASGAVTYIVESGAGLVGGGEIGVNIGMSADIPYNIENYMAFKMAEAVIHKEITKALAPLGAYLEISDRLEVFPVERLSLYINCRPCRGDGLPLSLDAADPLKILEAIRPVLSSISDVKIRPGELKAYKEVILNSYKADLQDMEKLVDKVLVRYSEGKDLVTGYKAAVDGVTADSVKRILSLLRDGAEVEYVII